MNYHIRRHTDQPHTLVVSYSFRARNAKTFIQIPFWRPGRYEAGNFGRNYFGFEAFADESPIAFRKVQPLVWELDTPIDTDIMVTYRCLAAELTAGNTYLDDDVMLINPVNALVYAHGFEEEPCRFQVEFPEGWTVASGFKKDQSKIEKAGQVHYVASGVQELFDTPVLAAANMKTLKYEENGIPFYVHLACEGLPNFTQLISDFEAFTRSQIKAFGGFPVDQYHFLILLLPYKAYHGVEHENSTVIIFGPSEELAQWPAYKELLGVSSHELYHTWNVKALRPADWTPYDFTGPDYSRLGYVAEGVTTYMGDWMLWNSGAFDDAGFLAELSTHMQRHIDNEGRLHQSLADSSVDTWIDGYGKAAPGRRVSIYVEGALLALICDCRLLGATEGDFGLNDVMRRLYEKFPKGRGYTEEDYWGEMAHDNNCDWTELRKKVVDGRGGIEDLLPAALSTVGIIIDAQPSALPWEAKHGLVLQMVGNSALVALAMSGSPAVNAGLWQGDIIVSIAGEVPQHYLETKLDIEGLELEVIRGGRQIRTKLKADGKVWRKIYAVEREDLENQLFDLWRNSVHSYSTNI